MTRNQIVAIEQRWSKLRSQLPSEDRTPIADALRLAAERAELLAELIEL